jgi:UDP-N-acetylmuramyl pentapeptide synthase
LAKAVEADVLKEQERQNERERHRERERVWLLERDELVGKCEHLAESGATLLVKGSRFMRMERVVRALTATETTEAH